MAAPSLLMHAAAWSQILPPLALVVTKGGRSAASWWISAGSLVSLGSDLAQRVLGTRGINNLWLSYALTPLMGGAFLWAMASMQPGNVGRLALRLTVPAYLVAWYGLTLTAEDTGTFSSFAYPFHSLLLLAAALWTLVVRGLEPSERQVLRTDWFWILGGLALYAAATAAIEPLFARMLRERVDLVIAAYQFRAGAIVVAFLAITWGILCQRRATRSGPSSSPARSG